MLCLDYAYQKSITQSQTMYKIDTVILIYNLLEYSDNFSLTSGSLWNYYRGEVNESANEIDDNDMINYNKTTNLLSRRQK